MDDLGCASVVNTGRTGVVPLAGLSFECAAWLKCLLSVPGLFSPFSSGVLPVNRL